jgi:sugar phosphate isomerase/epimerase
MPMPPRLLFCHAPFHKDLQAAREYRRSRDYAGIEWNLEGWRLMTPRARRRQLLERLREASPCASLHAPYIDLEIGHADPEHALAARRILQEYVDAAADLGAHHMNIHVGTFSPEPEDISFEGAVRQVSLLQEYAARKGVPVTVENLRGGPTGDPETFAAFLRATGIPVTLDLGHAAGCPWVLEGRGSVLEFVRAIPNPILASHVYLIERDDTHFAPQSADQMAPALDLLCERGCDFWVLELHSLEALERTRQAVDWYLDGRAKNS